MCLFVVYNRFLQWWHVNFKVNVFSITTQFDLKHFLSIYDKIWEFVLLHTFITEIYKMQKQCFSDKLSTTYLQSNHVGLFTSFCRLDMLWCDSSMFLFDTFWIFSEFQINFAKDTFHSWFSYGYNQQGVLTLRSCKQNW